MKLTTHEEDATLFLMDEDHGLCLSLYLSWSLSHLTPVCMECQSPLRVLEFLGTETYKWVCSFNRSHSVIFPYPKSHHGWSVWMDELDSTDDLRPHLTTLRPHLTAWLEQLNIDALALTLWVERLATEAETVFRLHRDRIVFQLSPKQMGPQTKKDSEKKVWTDEGWDEAVRLGKLAFAEAWRAGP